MMKYFILLKDKTAEKSSDPGRIPVFKGTLWHCNQEVNLKLKLHSMDSKGIFLQNVSQQSGDIGAISQEESELLYAVEKHLDRINVYENRKWLIEGCHLNCGSVVYVKIADESGNRSIPATVRFRGGLPCKNGIWFGLELFKEFRGLGTCDGSYKGTRYFTSDKQSAIFDTIDHLAPCPDPNEYVLSSTVDLRPERAGELTQSSNVKVGDRVAIFMNSVQEKAQVKWVGVLPDAENSVLMVGVEFDKPIGSGCGHYNGTKLFDGRWRHCCILPEHHVKKCTEQLDSDEPARSTDDRDISDAILTKESPKDTGIVIPKKSSDQYSDRKARSNKTPVESVDGLLYGNLK